MAHKIKLADGRSFDLQHESGCWSVSIDGKYFCAATREILVEGLETQFHLAKPKHHAPEKHPVQIADEMLRSETSSLVARQEAREDLKRHASRGDVTATLLLAALHIKPISNDAQQIVDRLRKNDFADVTHEELVLHVSHIPLRTRLIAELSERLRF